MPVKRGSGRCKLLRQAAGRWPPSRGAEFAVSPAVTRVKGNKTQFRWYRGAIRPELYAQGVFCWEERYMFQFRLSYTTQDILALYQVAAKARKRWGARLLQAFYVVIGLLTMVIGVLLLALGSSMVLGITLVVAGGFYVALGIFRSRLSARRAIKMRVDGASEVEVTLTDDGFRSQDQRGGENYLPYTAVCDLYHYRDRYFIYVDKKHATILPEGALIQGDLSALSGFLKEKTGRTITELK